MGDPERKTAFATLEEVVIAKIENNLREKTPVDFTKEDISIMRSAFVEAGVNYDITDTERRRILFGTKFRAKPELTEEGKKSARILVYDYGAKKGERWIPVWDLDRPKWSVFEEERSAGVDAMIGRKYFSLIHWSFDEAHFEQKYPGKIGENEGTEGRGLLQAAADLLSITILDEKDAGYDVNLKTFTDRVNRRLWKGYLKTIRQQDDVDVTQLGVDEALEYASKLKLRREEISARFKSVGIEELTSTLASFPPESLSELIRYLAEKPLEL